MTSLSDRVEAATADQQAIMLIEAFDLLEWRSRSKRGGFVEHNPRWFKFDRMIRAGAYESAAMSLVPEGFDFGCGSQDATGKAWAWCGDKDSRRADDWESMCPANSVTPALALTAASLRARGL